MDELTHGLAGEWSCLMLDRAVMTFGTWVENKLEERDPRTHKRIFTLKELISDKPLGGIKQAILSGHYGLPPTLKLVEKDHA